MFTASTGRRPYRQHHLAAAALVVVYTPGGAETGLDELPDARILDPGVAPRWSQVP